MADPRETLPMPPMDWTQGQILLGWGAILNALLYLSGVFVVALWKGADISVFLALLAAAITFLSYSFRFTGAPVSMQLTLHWASWVIGTAAGLSLLYTVIA